jgi:hypothetical protein
LAPAARTHRKYHRTGSLQAERHIEWYKLANGSDAGTEYDLSIGHDTDDRSNTVLGATEVAGYGIVATGRRSEYEVGILATNARHEQELVRQEIDIAIINGGPIIVLGGGRCASVSRR